MPPEHAPTLSSPRISGERFFAIDLGDRFFGDPSLKFESWLTIWRSRLTRRIFGIRRLRRSPPPPERPIIQAIKTPAALREADVHAVINERVRRYPKLSWKLSRLGSFCLRDRMPVCSINRLLCERVSMPDAQLQSGARGPAFPSGGTPALPRVRRPLAKLQTTNLGVGGSNPSGRAMRQ